ncbi:hypothetical protein NEOLEDRAFT_902839 [Neolentinus lepideus HHB14362 ss-1]|uniref:Uncharacterized protein n=1 Tax=Neolentinus lepideus HHB14362 ss-1 TaxID=1314782 RepID=A0A165NQB5_9AGAM|nr:hypothetical protein NEOLEDRAFT_902839 [Neolentinus lepideus HHB14362 ss-1]
MFGKHKNFTSTSTSKRKGLSVKRTVKDRWIFKHHRKCKPLSIRSGAATQPDSSRRCRAEWPMLAHGAPESSLGTSESCRSSWMRRHLTSIRNQLIESERTWIQEELMELCAEFGDLKQLVEHAETDLARTQRELEELMLALQDLSGDRIS